MRRSLADSLSYIIDEVGAELGIAAPDASAAISDILSHRIAPGAFGRYYKLVPAVERGDMAEAKRLLRAIIHSVRREQAFVVTPLSGDVLGEDAALYAELVTGASDGGCWLRPPRQEFWPGFDRKVQQALDVITRVDPALAAELNDLVVQVAGASPIEGHSFGGASSFMLWGLVILNVEVYCDVPSLIEGLVHEAAHQLLFACSIEEPLVTNPLTERYPSPLRRDDRPMDGIFHATFVTARLHYIVSRLRDAGQTCPVPVETLAVKLSGYRALYFGGIETIETYGQLTATGRIVLDESLRYMRAA